ncbi:MAG TPA: hypothetical protein VN883_13665 [Myxococcales bacterium]|jgi:hypothetical protein|nr:hypothetical protein [Myxococcales bacterium]
MKPSLGICCLAVLVSAAATAQQDTPSIDQADDASETGLQFALRTGFMLPFGKTADRPQASLSDSYSGFLPIWIEGGYRFTPNLFAGAFFQYAFGFTKNCPPSFDCSGSDLRVGAEGHYHFMPGRMADPWLGVGLGYEWLRASISSGSISADATLHGFEFVDFQAGIDFAVTRKFSVGPFAALTLAQYRTISVSSGGQSSSALIDKRALHELLIFGVRGTFGP